MGAVLRRILLLVRSTALTPVVSVANLSKAVRFICGVVSAELAFCLVVPRALVVIGQRLNQRHFRLLCTYHVQLAF